MKWSRMTDKNRDWKKEWKWNRKKKSGDVILNGRNDFNNWYFDWNFLFQFENTKQTKSRFIK